MKSFAKFGLVGAFAFLGGAAWQFDFPQEKETVLQTLSPPSSPVQEAPKEEALEAKETSSPLLSAIENRALEHYRQVIQLGVAERLVQQRVHAEALRKREALAASKQKAQELAQIEKHSEEQKRQIEREKIRNQLMLATAKAQEAQADLAHEKAQQAAMETQWLMREQQRRREELASLKNAEQHRRKESKQQKLINIHNAHHLISNNKTRDSEGCEQQHSRPSRQNQNSSASSPPPTQRTQRKPSPRGSQSVHHRSAASGYKETVQRQAQKQRELIRSALKR
ncbi:MAG: hypothetical protein ACSHYB_01040 [Roseibacillus sp.]